MARFQKYKDHLSQEDGTETWRTIYYRRSTWTNHISITITRIMEDSQRLSCHITPTISENEIYGKNYPEPPAELEDGEEVYEVETILNHRKRGRSYQYYVKWKGNPVSDASWELEQAFSDDGDTLSRYKRRHKLWNPKRHAFPPRTTMRNELDVCLAAQQIVWHHGRIVLHKVGTRKQTKPNYQWRPDLWLILNNRTILKTSLSTILLFC